MATKEIERVARLEREVRLLKSQRKGLRQKLTNLHKRVGTLVRYLEANEGKFQTKARPQFLAEVESVRSLLPKKHR